METKLTGFVSGEGTTARPQRSTVGPTEPRRLLAPSTKVDGLSAVTADVAADFNAFKTAMEAERDNLSDEGQAALDAANAKLDAARAQLNDLDVAVGDADGSEVPPPVEGTSPGNDAPAEGGVDGTPAAPAEDSLPAAGEGSDLSVDAPVNPDDQDAPRPTA